ncbi:MAG: methyltransferase domain-containing protein [Bacteroidetes bacterium]|nr:methyltransferase domain-containing protein [Bacteroidota bacterium]
MNIQVPPETYNDISYNDNGRFNSYWHQINAVIQLRPKSVLEIGTGNGLVRYVLEKNGVKVTTVDIDENLRPDILASVLSIPVHDDSFDLALCCQVLEHLPYEKFIPALSEIRRVISKNLILSLPDLHRAYRFSFQIPLLGELKWLYKVPRLKPLDWQFNGEHYWNISCKNYSLSRIKRDIEAAGFTINATFCVFEMPWHRFFILTKH